MLKGFTKRLLAFLTILCIILTTSNTTVTAKGKTSENNDTDTSLETMTSTWDGKTKESLYMGNGFKATFKLQTNLLAGFYATIKLENTGDTKIENWA
jgi:hypothetical protein